jgi:hypothetical protein
MTNLVEFKVINGPKVLRALDQFEHKTRKVILRKATRAGGAVFVKSAKRHAPIRTGRLKRSITQKVKTYPSGTVVSITGQRRGSQLKDTKKIRARRGGISGQGKVVPIHLVDQPTRGHHIHASEGRVLYLGAHWWSFSVYHPGTRGRNFMVRSYDSDRQQALYAWERKAEFEIDREANKIQAQFTRYG